MAVRSVVKLLRLLEILFLIREAQAQGKDETQKDDQTNDDDPRGKATRITRKANPNGNGPCSKEKCNGNREGDGQIPNVWGPDEGQGGKAGGEKANSQGGLYEDGDYQPVPAGYTQHDCGETHEQEDTT